MVLGRKVPSFRLRFAEQQDVQGYVTWKTMLVSFIFLGLILLYKFLLVRKSIIMIKEKSHKIEDKKNT